MSFRTASKSYFRTREKRCWIEISAKEIPDYPSDVAVLLTLFGKDELWSVYCFIKSGVWHLWLWRLYLTYLAKLTTLHTPWNLFFRKENDENLRNCKFQILHFARQLKKFNFDLTKSIQQDEHETNLKRKSRHNLQNRWCCTGTSFEITRFQDLAMFDKPWLAKVSWKRLDFLIP